MTAAKDTAGAFDLTPVRFSDLPGVSSDDLISFWPPFFASCRAIVDDAPELRKAIPPTESQKAIGRQALALGSSVSTDEIRAFLEGHFTPCLITPEGAVGRAFFTAYYRPEVRASSVRSPDFSEPLLGRPADLVTLSSDETFPHLQGLSSARRSADGALHPYATRMEIDSGALGALAQPVAYVRDAIEAFMIHVQGSARLILEDGRSLDLTYAGRNGHPYTSIGKMLIERGEISLQDMSLDRLKDWVRANGQEPGEAGRTLLQANHSFVFFSAKLADPGSTGPIGAAGLPLTPFRSIAIDRSLWSYGLPFWVEADVIWSDSGQAGFCRMAIGQDTGAAILGPARADLFFGDGADAGRRAGDVRHYGRIFVLLPKGDAK